MKIREWLISALFLFSFSSSAALITNGSFEQNDVRNNGWKWFNASDVNGWEGANIEIWDSLQRFESYDGDQHAELNSHAWRGEYSIYQTFDSVASQRYLVSFAYAARRRSGESFRFDIIDSNDQVLFTQIVNDHLQKQWKTFFTSFSATTSDTTIRFTSLNRGTYGNFLDDIQVETLTPLRLARAVSSPASVGILLLACTILYVRRSQKPH